MGGALVAAVEAVDEVHDLGQARQEDEDGAWVLGRVDVPHELIEEVVVDGRFVEAREVGVYGLAEAGVQFGVVVLVERVSVDLLVIAPPLPQQMRLLSCMQGPSCRAMHLGPFDEDEQLNTQVV